MDRRTVIAGAAAMPLLPALALPAEADPVIAAYPEWQAIRADYMRVLANYSALERRYGNCAPEAEAYNDGPVTREMDRMMECERRIAGMVATTAAGMAVQLRVWALGYGHFDKAVDDSTESRFVRSLLAGAERMAGNGAA